MSVSLIVGIDMAKKSFTAAYRIGEAGYDLGNFANTPSSSEVIAIYLYRFLPGVYRWIMRQRWRTERVEPVHREP